MYLLAIMYGQQASQPSLSNTTGRKHVFHELVYTPVICPFGKNPVQFIYTFALFTSYAAHLARKELCIIWVFVWYITPVLKNRGLTTISLTAILYVIFPLTVNLYVQSYCFFFPLLLCCNQAVPISAALCLCYV